MSVLVQFILKHNIYIIHYTILYSNIGRHGADDRELEEFIYIGFSEGGKADGHLE